jgi:hypothetical protein
MISSAKKKLLHVAKRELGLSDEDYRAILRKHTGMTSSADPNFADFHFKEIIDHLKLVYNFQVKSKFRQNYPREPDALPSPEHLRKLQHVIDDFAQYEPAARRRDFQKGFNERVIKRAWPQTRHEVNTMIEAWASRLRRAEDKARKKLFTTERTEGFRPSPLMGEGNGEGDPVVVLTIDTERALPEECPF